MEIFRHYTGLPAGARGGAVAIGNFDGIHLGHQFVIRKAGELARTSGVKQGVLTFEPHPRSVFQPGLPPFRLTPFRVKAELLRSLGIDLLYNLHFDLAFAALSAEDFVRDVLVAELAAKDASLRATNVAVPTAAKIAHSRRSALTVTPTIFHAPRRINAITAGPMP